MKISLNVLRLRRGVQWLVLAGLCALPWINAKGWNAVMGNFYALNVFGVPVADPLGVAQTLVSGFVPGGQLWLGAGLVLVLALMLGRVFCGWACPYGLLSELLWQVGGHRGSTEPQAPSAGTVETAETAETAEVAGAARTAETGGAACSAEAVAAQDLGRTVTRDMGWGVRGMLTLVGLAICAVLGLPLLNALSAPGSISLAPLLLVAEDWSVVALVLAPVAGLLVLESALGRRWWCRYGCPQSLVLMGAAWLGRRFGGKNVLAVRWAAGCCSCKGVEPCTSACSMGLRPRGKKGPAAAHCVQCGDCVTACAHHGKALSLGMGENTVSQAEQR